MIIDPMSLEEFEQHKSDISAVILSYENYKKAVVIAALEEVAGKAGFSLEELFDEAWLGRSRSNVAAKYVNPSDPSQTWSGRGLKPKWLTKMLASGKTLEDAAF